MLFAYPALYSLIKLLINIKNDMIFIPFKVSCLRVLSWCCFGVAIITLAGAFYYPTLIIITAAASFMRLILRVVKNVMQAAVELREENDLTI